MSDLIKYTVAVDHGDATPLRGPAKLPRKLQRPSFLVACALEFSKKLCCMAIGLAFVCCGALGGAVVC